MLLASLAMSASAFSADPSDLFLRAYQDFQTAEKLEREGKPREALGKYESARDLLQQASQADPEWRPLVIGYRLEKTVESISRLQDAVAALPPAAEPIEGSLPEADSAPAKAVSLEPVIAVTPPVGAARSPRRSTTAITATPSPVPRIRSGGTSTEQELRRQVAELRQENERLNEKFQQKSAELKSAKMEVEKTKVTVVEFKAQYAQIREELENSKKDGNSLAAIREQYAKRAEAVFQELTEVQAQNEVLLEENDRLLTKLDAAAQYIADSDAIRLSLLKERKDIAGERDSAVAKNKKLKDSSAELDRIAGENKELKTKLAKSVAKGEFEKVMAENKALAKKLAAAEANSNREEIVKVVAEKKLLEEQIARMEREFKDAASPEKDKIIATLQSELNSVNDKLLEAQAQMSRGDEQLKDLQKQLDETSGALAELKLNPIPGKEEKALLAENDLLRGIILRQIKEQTARDDAKKELEKEIATLQIKSDVIQQQLQVLAAPVLQLTPEERSLFKEPVALLSEPASQALEVTMAVIKPTEEEAVANLKPAAPEGPEDLPEDVREQIQSAKKFFENKNYVEAEKIYQGIVERLPDNYFALSNLGAVQIEAGKLSAAEVALKKAIQINGEDSYACTNLGIVYSRQGKFDDAISALRRSLEINAGDAVAHNYLGVCLGQKDKRDDAEAEFKRAIDLKPDYPEAHFNLAVLYATTQPQSLALAKEHYAKATALGAAPDASLERLIQ